jgi:EAL domain-containing protein (putative c-di-GMP-specific phosphodiesterase class I)
MYHAKSEGRNRFFFYQDSMRAASAQRLSLEHDLRKNRRRPVRLLLISAVMSPPARSSARSAIRWNHRRSAARADTSSRSPEAGLIGDLGVGAGNRAIQHNAWLQQGLPPVTIVNLFSGTQRSGSQTDSEIARVAGVPLDYLELEVTESMLMEDFDAAVKNADRLARDGRQDCHR